MSSVHNTTARAGNCSLCITTHHCGGLWSEAFPGVCTDYFSGSRGADSIHWQLLRLAAVQAMKRKRKGLSFDKLTAQPLASEDVPRLSSSSWTGMHLWAWQGTKNWLATKQERPKHSQEKVENTFLNKERELVGKCC